MAKIKRILLAEDNQNDVELTLAALQECRLSNEVEVVRDGAEALDYIYKRGKYSERGRARSFASDQIRSGFEACSGGDAYFLTGRKGSRDEL
jgi:CheY-like chemotaxis protein